VAGLDRQQRRMIVEGVVDVLFDARKAARREPAARRQVDQVGDVARDDASSSRALPDDRDRADEPARVGVQRLAEQRHDVGLLHDLAGVHHGDPVAHLGHDAEVVRDQDDRGPGLVAELAHEIEDLGLDRDVERGGRLVGDQQLGLAGEGHGDHDPLGHAARHLVRERLEPPVGIGDADHAQQLAGALPGRAGLHLPVELEHFRDLLADLPDRVQRRCRLLEDHRDPLAADPAQLVLGHRDQVRPVEDDLAALDLPRLGHETEDRQARHALAAARLADQAHDLAPSDLEVDAVDRAHDTGARVERRAQPAHLEERPIVGRARRARGAWNELLDHGFVEARPQRDAFVGGGRCGHRPVSG
jgi:hypothetical protein